MCSIQKCRLTPSAAHASVTVNASRGTGAGGFSAATAPLPFSPRDQRPRNLAGLLLPDRPVNIGMAQADQRRPQIAELHRDAELGAQLGGLRQAAGAAVLEPGRVAVPAPVVL